MHADSASEEIIVIRVSVLPHLHLLHYPLAKSLFMFSWVMDQYKRSGFGDVFRPQISFLNKT